MGTIAAVGSRVRRFTPGDIVYAYSFDNSNGGFYAEYVAVAAERVGRPPRILSLRDAGAVATTGLTALQGIDDALRLRRGESVAIHGASGGVGSLAVQFAKMRGAACWRPRPEPTASDWSAGSVPMPQPTDVTRILLMPRSVSLQTESMPCWRLQAGHRLHVYFTRSNVAGGLRFRTASSRRLERDAASGLWRMTRRLAYRVRTSRTGDREGAPPGSDRGFVST